MNTYIGDRDVEEISIKKIGDRDIGLINGIETIYCNEFNSFPRDKVFLTVVDDTIAGWIHINIPDNPLHSGFVFVYVLPDYRRRGIGTAVYRIAEKQFLEVGCNWWSSYPESDVADKFALSVGFDYTNTNSTLVHNGEIVPISNEGIRVCRTDDYKAFDSIWSNEYAAMHKRLGLPYEARENTEDEERENYNAFCENLNNNFVLEVGGSIVGMGSLFDDNSGIGALAVDKACSGKGYGTRLAAFLTNECIKRGVKTPLHYCETNNDDAMHIYKKIGYIEQKRESVAFHK